VIIEPQDTQDDDILAIAEAVGVVTIPNPKPQTLMNHVVTVLTAVGDAVIRRWDARPVKYIGRHRLKEPKLQILRRLMNAGTRLDLRVLATLRSIGRPPQDVQRALNQIRNTTDRARRDISFFHTYIHGMTDIGERGYGAPAS
jgi:hypothetical protein